MWEDAARIFLTNTDESKKYWLLMALVIRLSWVHISIWATALKTQPTKKNHPTLQNPQQNKASKPLQSSWELFFERCCKLPGHLKSCKGVENRCRVLVKWCQILLFSLTQDMQTYSKIIPSSPSPRSCYRLSNSSFPRTANRDKFGGCNSSW